MNKKCYVQGWVWLALCNCNSFICMGSNLLRALLRLKVLTEEGREWAREERMSSRSRRYGFLSLLSLTWFEAIPPIPQEQGPTRRWFCMVLNIPLAVSGSQYTMGRCLWGLLKNTACSSGFCTLSFFSEQDLLKQRSPELPQEYGWQWLGHSRIPEKKLMWSNSP